MMYGLVEDITLSCQSVGAPSCASCKLLVRSKMGWVGDSPPCFAHTAFVKRRLPMCKPKSRKDQPHQATSSIRLERPEGSNTFSSLFLPVHCDRSVPSMRCARSSWRGTTSRRPFSETQLGILQSNMIQCVQSRDKKADDRCLQRKVQLRVAPYQQVRSSVSQGPSTQQA